MTTASSACVSDSQLAVSTKDKYLTNSEI